MSVLPPWIDAARAEVREERAEDAEDVDALVLEEALVLDREDRAHDMRREIVHPDELALRPVRPVVGADRLGVEREDAAVAPVGVADRRDLRAGQRDLDLDGGLGLARVRERAAVELQLPRLEPVAPRRDRLGPRQLAVAEAVERPLEVGDLPVEPAVEDGRRREHLGRDAEEPPVEAGAHDPVEVRRLAAGPDAERERDAPEPPAEGRGGR